MAVYLVTGRSGTGKTTIGKELSQRGYKVFDGDKIPGLARWEDTKTGKPVSVDTDDYVDFAKVGWNWDGRVLKKLLNEKSGLQFVCGSASNQLAFHGLFDDVFILVLDEKTHEHRIVERKNYGNYGKHPKMLKELVEEQQQFSKQALKRGAIPIDATDTIESVVDDILRHVDHDT